MGPLRRSLIAVTFLVVVAGCSGGGDEKPSDGGSATPEPYSSAAKLTAALTKAGIPCPKWVPDDNFKTDYDAEVLPQVSLSASSSSCLANNGTTARRAKVAVFPSTETRDESLQKLLSAGEWSPDSFAVGPNWWYVGADSELVAKKFHTKIVKPEFEVDPSPPVNTEPRPLPSDGAEE